MKKVIIILGAIVAFVLAYLSYQYLALKLFQVGLSDFYNIAPEVTEQCTEVVKDAAVAFSGLYDDVAISIAVMFVCIGILFCVLAMRKPIDTCE